MKFTLVINEQMAHNAHINHLLSNFFSDISIPLLMRTFGAGVAWPSQTTRLVSIWDQRRLCVTVRIVWIKVGFWRSNLDAHFFIWDKKDVVYSVLIGLIKDGFWRSIL